ncbi:MAG TPA: methyltransferase [Vicinamibacterales bacterium]|nr:methyltransferase [Vicinamibacterales bacterium]
MPDLASILHVLPWIVFGWIVICAGFIFTSVGRRDPRGWGIGISMWATVLTTQRVAAPPLALQVIGIAGLVSALVLFHWAAASIRGHVFSFASSDDLPQFVHRAGPYVYIRNPFYASYLLAEIATVIMWPSAWGALVVGLAFGYFEWLARFEEGKFSRSGVAAEYADYKARTGRLVPRL